ncbi:hypothetical protein [Allosphingosinicella vermicomposti]|uniref:hypothetical protein n=1 Tax=Allosphingosinicella vermicomposti TaxID=614671 RepID=UPI000D108D19|nr:hypothetical protein [Allosphingosinicella vermicomposti]
MSMMILGLSALAFSALRAAPQPADQFVEALSALCGKAYEGRIVSPAASGDDAFAGKALVMHVRDCKADVVRIPFHVGEDRSRTWVVSRTETGLRLKHDHRHEDGSEDKLTQYGGDTVSGGMVDRQEFPADPFSKEMFVAGSIPASVTNVWAMEVHPGRTFAYELRRPEGRFFRVEFDLTKPVAVPPGAWGYSPN